MPKLCLHRDGVVIFDIANHAGVVGIDLTGSKLQPGLASIEWSLTALSERFGMFRVRTSPTPSHLN